MKTIDDISFNNKRAIVRVDFNVPMNDGVVEDDTRIVKALPTIKKLIDDGAKIILMSHLGRPKGNGFESKYSLFPVAQKLSQLINKPVIFCNDITGEETIEKIASLENGDVLLLENLRFDAREKKNDEKFASELASLADVYVNDAFGTAHRAHASTCGISKYLPAYAGYLIKDEVDHLSSILNSPDKPFVAILGGSKVSDKIQIIDRLIERCDSILIGGGMCYTFLYALGKKIGNSLFEPDLVETTKQLLKKAKENNTKILLPIDFVCASSIGEDVDVCICTENIDNDLMGLDIGPKTSKEYEKEIKQAKTVFWNGPMGVFENKLFAQGTKTIAQAMANNKSANTIIGGGDSVSAVNMFNLANEMSFVSTGGGASMEFIQGNTLPGIDIL